MRTFVLLLGLLFGGLLSAQPQSLERVLIGLSEDARPGLLPDLLAANPAFFPYRESAQFKGNRYYLAWIDPGAPLAPQNTSELEALLQRLHHEGVTQVNKAHSVPPVPLRVGLVTSAGSAASEDFLTEIRQSDLGFQITACDSRVQGDLAPQTLIAGLRTLYQHDLDVIADADHVIDIALPFCALIVEALPVQQMGEQPAEQGAAKRGAGQVRDKL